MQLAGLDQRGQHRPVFRALVAAGEERIFSVQSNRAHAALDGVGVDLDAAVIEEAHQPVPVVEAVADEPGRSVEPPGSLCQGFLEPGLQRLDQRLGLLLPRRPAFVGALAADLGFDLVEFGNPLQGLGGDRRRRRFGEVEELPAPMCPTEGERRRSAGALRIGKGAIAGIAVGLQHAGIALQQRRGVIAAAPRRVAVHHRRRRAALPRPVVAGERPEVTLSWCARGQGRAPAPWSRRRTAWSSAATPRASAATRGLTSAAA